MCENVNNHATTLALLNYGVTAAMLNSKSTCLCEYKFEVVYGVTAAILNSKSTCLYEYKFIVLY